MADKANTPEAGTPPPGAGSNAASAQGTSLTKIDAVKQALKALGKGASRADIQKFVKDHYDYEMTLDHISNCKGEIARKSKGKGKGKARKAAPRPAATKEPAKAAAARPTAPAVPARPARIVGNGKHAVLLADIVTLRDLVQRIGREQVRTLIDVMSK
jgi:hypothetical protein